MLENISVLYKCVCKSSMAKAISTQKTLKIGEQLVLPAHILFTVLPVHKWPKCLPAHVSTKITFTHNASPWANNATGIRTPGLMKQFPDPSGPLKCPSTGQIYCSYETLRESCWPACKHSDFNKVKCNVSEKRVIFTPRRNPLQLVANVLIALKVLLSCVNN